MLLYIFENIELEIYEFDVIVTVAEGKGLKN